MAKTYGIKDAVSGKLILDANSKEPKPLETDYETAARICRGIRHYEGTDYFVVELSF